MNSKLSDIFKIIYEKYYRKYNVIFSEVIEDIKTVLSLIFNDFNHRTLIETNTPVLYIRNICKNLFEKLDVFIKDMEDKNISDYKDLHTFFSDIFYDKEKKININTKKSKFITDIAGQYSGIKIMLDKLDFQILLPFVQVSTLYCKAILNLINNIYNDIVDKFSNDIEVNNSNICEMFNKKYNNSIDIFLKTDKQLYGNLLNIHYINNFNVVLENKNYVKNIKKMEMYMVYNYMNKISYYVNKEYKGSAKTLLNKICFPDVFQYDYGKQILILYKDSEYSLTKEILNPYFIESLITIIIFLKKVELELTINNV